VLCARAEPRIQWVPSAERINVEVSGLDDAALAAVRDWPAEKWARAARRPRAAGQRAAMLGAWTTEARVLRFTPQFSAHARRRLPRGI